MRMTKPGASCSICFVWIICCLLGTIFVPSSVALLVQALASNNIGGTGLLLKDAVCLVTGASRGIGKGIALELGRQGATVYITGTTTTSTITSSTKTLGKYATTPETGGPGTIEETANAVTQAGGIGIPVLCNHANDEDVQALMHQIQQDHGRLDMLVNNAFRIPPGAPKSLVGKQFWEQGMIEAWDTVHTVGLRSHYVASCLAMQTPGLLQAACQTPHPNMPRPLIAMISSFGGLAYTFNVPYGVAKAGVDRLAKDMAVELGDDICVTSFWPGLVNTERTQESVKTGEFQKYVNLPLENAESPQFTGRAIVAVATDPNNSVKTGTYQVVAELAEEYEFTDIDGTRPPSIRSLRFLLPSYAFTEEQRKKIPPSLIPDWKLPFFIMSQGAPPPKKE